MSLSIAIFFMVVGVALTVGILVAGIVSMVRGGEFNAKWGNRLMRMRVVAQLFAVIMFAIGVYLLKHM